MERRQAEIDPIRLTAIYPDSRKRLLLAVTHPGAQARPLANEEYALVWPAGSDADRGCRPD
ncbi:MAG: hypothetical protein ABSB22_14765 [Thermodesulfobacteriota bacterium]|jgi:hypothetical protein